MRASTIQADKCVVASWRNTVIYLTGRAFAMSFFSAAFVCHSAMYDRHDVLSPFLHGMRGVYVCRVVDKIWTGGRSGTGKKNSDAISI
jgi:hypothetical protein